MKMIENHDTTLHDWVFCGVTVNDGEASFLFALESDKKVVRIAGTRFVDVRPGEGPGVLGWIEVHPVNEQSFGHLMKYSFEFHDDWIVVVHGTSLNYLNENPHEITSPL